MGEGAFFSHLGQEEGAAPRAAPRLRAREPFTVRVVVGRLVELRLFDLGLPRDVRAMSDAVLAASTSVGGRAILLADHRAAGPFAHDVGDAWSRDMRRFNASIVRSAILLDRTNATYNLQLARVVHCAGCPRRRWFYEPSEARGWLSDVATDAERLLLDVILS